MKWSLASNVMIFAALSIAAAPSAMAQISPTDSGAGTKLGLAQLNNSGEAGTVTLFRRGASKTLVVLNVVSEPEGRSQPAHIHRGHECATLNPKPAYGLAPVVNGNSKTLVNVPIDTLLSGNYVVNVHASAQNIGRYVSCGELHS